MKLPLRCNRKGIAVPPLMLYNVFAARKTTIEGNRHHIAVGTSVSDAAAGNLRGMKHRRRLSTTSALTSHRRPTVSPTVPFVQQSRSLVWTSCAVATITRTNRRARLMLVLTNDRSFTRWLVESASRFANSSQLIKMRISLT